MGGTNDSRWVPMNRNVVAWNCTSSEAHDRVIGIVPTGVGKKAAVANCPDCGLLQWKIFGSMSVRARITLLSVTAAHRKPLLGIKPGVGGNAISCTCFAIW